MQPEVGAHSLVYNLKGSPMRDKIGVIPFVMIDYNASRFGHVKDQKQNIIEMNQMVPLPEAL